MDIVESLRRASAGASHADPMRGVLFTCGEGADEIERLRAMLNKYGGHTVECSVGSESPCTCGFDNINQQEGRKP